MVYFNEEKLEAPRGTTLAELLALAGLDPAQVVVSVDGRIVARADFKHTAPADGARVKIGRASCRERVLCVV